MEKLQFKNPPMSHQLAALRRAYPLNEFGLFMEMGTGKTYVTINLAAGRFLKEQIDRLLVICPTPIKPVWIEEFENHCPVDYEIRMVSGTKKYDELQPWAEGKLKVLVVGIEALSQGGERTKGGKLRIHTESGAYGIASRFLRDGNSMVAVDESSKIKSANSMRTKRVIELGGIALYRCILTGTPITQGLHDFWSQFQFLNGNILGCKSFTVFKNRYCIMGGFQGKKILGYQFEDDLYERVSPYIYQVKTIDCIDLPERIYSSVSVEPTATQKSLIKKLREESGYQEGDKSLEVSTVLDLYIRFQQICGGSMPYAIESEQGIEFETEAIKGPNPKLAAFGGIIDEIPNDKKVVIFAKYKPEQKYIEALLTESSGPDSVARYTGEEDEETRTSNYTRFREDKSCRFFITSQQVGGFGLNLTSAHYTIFYSNSFSYEERKQAEYRTFRKGQRDKCIYIDIEMQIEADRMILKAVRQKRDFADLVWEKLDNETKKDL